MHSLIGHILQKCLDWMRILLDLKLKKKKKDSLITSIYQKMQVDACSAIEKSVRFLTTTVALKCVLIFVHRSFTEHLRCMTCKIFLELENYEYAFMRLLKRFSVEALCIFSANIYASYAEVIFYGHPGVRCLWDFQSIFAFKIIPLRIPQEVYLVNEHLSYSWLATRIAENNKTPVHLFIN